MYSKNILVIACCVFACVLARPSDVPPEKLQPTVIPIVSQSEELDPNGTYKFSYETGNGIKREETAYEKVLPKTRSAGSDESGESDGESDEIHVQQGSYSYTAPDGTIITVRYIADENGFQPIGDHLPRSPVVAKASAAPVQKAGRALNVADSTESASAPIEAKSVEKQPEPAPVSLAAETVKTAAILETKETKEISPDVEKTVTESESNEGANVDVSTEVASTAAPAQPSTGSEQANPALAEQTTSAPDQSAEITESSSSTSAPAESSASEILGQSTATEVINQSSGEETEQPSTNAPELASVETSNSTTDSA